MNKTIPWLFLMKITAVIQILILSFPLSVAGIEQELLDRKVSVNVESAEFLQVLLIISKQADVKFAYSPELVQGKKQVSLHVKDERLSKVLETLFGPGVSFKVVGKQIVLTPVKMDSSRVEIPSPALIQVSGKVSDENGDPLPGVNIVIKGTSAGTTTDANGEYKLEVEDNEAVLIFSFIGFVSQEVNISNRSTIHVTLHEDAETLGEVVVVGYAMQKKESVVGAISNLSSETLTRRGGVSNLGSALSGQLSGVTVMEVTGEPGGPDPQILIRGQSTWNGSQPLILVDGIERKMNDINVNEVASISVLKDASATAVFGVKGANGVILITTKRGSVGKPQLTFSANQAVKSVSKLPTKLDAFEAKSWKNAAIENEISSNEAAWQYYTPYEELLFSRKPQVAPYSYLYPNVDWVEEATKDYALSSRYNMNVSGGTPFAKYFASLGYIHDGDILASQYNNQKGYDPGFGYDRFNFRANLDFALTKTTTLTTNINGYVGKQKSTNADFGGGGQTFGHIYRGLYELAPDAFPVKYPSGRYGKDPRDINMNNPLAILNEGGVRHINRRHIGTDLKLDQKLDFITKGLSFAANIAWDNYVSTNGPSILDGGNQGQVIYEFQDAGILNAETRADSLGYMYIHTTAGASGINEFDFVLRPWTVSSEAVNNNSLERALFYQAGFSYARTFNKHDVTGLVLFNRRANAQGSDFASYREDWVGRVTHSYAGKYFWEVNGAYNGSEKFSKKYRFGFFPSAAVGWLISSENFMGQFTWLNLLKVRGSVGKVGSDSGIPRWGYMGSWEFPGSGVQRATTFYGANGQPLQYSPYLTYREGVIPNQNIRWETATKSNVGVEIAVLNDRLTFEMDVFQDHRNDIFMTAARRNVPSFFGAAPVAANLGETKTKGYEMTLGYGKASDTGIGYQFMVGMTRAIDVVLRSEDPMLLPDYQKVVGFQIGQTRTQVHTGFLNNWDDLYASAPVETNMAQRLPGDWDMLDFNGDGVINTLDNVAYGFPDRPEKTYNASMGLNYKKLSLWVQFFGVTNINFRTPYVTPALQRWTAVSSELGDYWTPEDQEAFYKAPRLTTSSPTGQFGLYDGSYLRLKTVEVAYVFEGGWLQQLGVSNARVSLNGNNLFFWSELPMDRETGSFDIQGGYPMYKQFNLGLEITF